MRQSRGPPPALRRQKVGGRVEALQFPGDAGWRADGDPASGDRPDCEVRARVPVIEPLGAEALEVSTNERFVEIDDKGSGAPFVDGARALIHAARIGKVVHLGLG